MALRNAFEELSTTSDSAAIRMLLQMILERLGYPNPAQGSMRATIADGTVTTVSTVSNISATGGFNTNNDQQVQFFMAASQLRNRITVS